VWGKTEGVGWRCGELVLRACAGAGFYSRARPYVRSGRWRISPGSQGGAEASSGNGGLPRVGRLVGDGCSGAEGAGAVAGLLLASCGTAWTRRLSPACSVGSSSVATEEWGGPGRRWRRARPRSAGGEVVGVVARAVGTSGSPRRHGSGGRGLRSPSTTVRGKRETDKRGRAVSWGERELTGGSRWQ
jgi:hypothetical protein